VSILDELNIRHIYNEKDTYVNMEDFGNYFIRILHDAMLHNQEHLHNAGVKERIFFAGMVEGIGIVMNTVMEIAEMQQLHTNVRTADDLLKIIDKYKS